MVYLSKDGKELEEGLYTDKEPKNFINGQLYRVYQENETWMAENSRGELLKVTYPQGLPNSRTIPKGHVDVTTLTYIDKREILPIASRIRQKLNFLEKNISNYNFR